MAANGDGRGADYRLARLIVAAAFTLVILFILVNDVLRADYAPDAVIVGTLVGGIITLLGIELVNWRR